MICGKLSDRLKIMFKKVYDTSGNGERFQQMCAKLNYTPEEVLEELEIDSSSSQPIIQSDTRQGALEGNFGYSNYTLYYDLGGLKKAKNDFKQWIIEAALITTVDGKVVFKNPLKMNMSFMDLKIRMLNNLACEFGIEQINPEKDNIDTQNNKAHDILLNVFNNLNSRDEVRKTELKNKFVFIKHFDAIVGELAPYVKINPKFNNEAHIIINDKYDYDRASVKHFKGFSTDEFASAENMSSAFAKTILNALPQLDAVGNPIPGKYTSFNAFMSCCSLLKNWISKTNNKHVDAELNKGVNADLGKIVQYYLNSTNRDSLRTHFNVITKLLYAKQDNDYIVPEEYRHIVTNMFIKFVNSSYLQQIWNGATNTYVSVPLTERITLIERTKFRNAVAGGIVNISRNPEDFYSILPADKTIDELNYAELIHIVKYITNIEFQAESESPELSKRLQAVIKYVDTKVKQINQSNNIEKGITDYLKDYHTDMFGTYADIAKILASYTMSDVRSVIKNADGNNLPLNQLPSLVYRAADLAKRAGKRLATGFSYVYDNLDNIHQPIIQTTATINGDNVPIAKMSVEDLLTVAIENNFINQLLIPADKGLRTINNDGKRRIYVQLDCYSDKNTIFLFPIDLNGTYDIYDTPLTGVENKLKQVLKNGWNDELFNSIFTIYHTFYRDRLQQVIRDYKKVFGIKIDSNVSDGNAWELIKPTIENKIKELGLNGFIQEFVKAGIDCVENVHYDGKGVNNTLKDLYDTFSNEDSAKKYIKSQIALATKTLVGDDSTTELGTHYSGAWEHICENDLLKSFLKLNSLESRKSTFATKRHAISSGEDFIDESEFYEDFTEEYDDEGQSAQKSIDLVDNTYIPDNYAEHVVTAFTFADLLFARPLNCFFVGDFYAHKGGDIASKYIMQTKRQSIQGATVHTYAMGMKYGMSEDVNFAIIDDDSTVCTNIIGDVSEIDANDGSGRVSPIISRMANVSLLDAEVGANKKTTFADINPNTGTAVYVKWAEYEITNELMRNMGSSLNMRNLFYKMHNKELPSSNVSIKTYTPANLYYYDIEKGQSYKLERVTINGETKTATITTSQNGISATYTTSFNSIDDIFKLLGDAFCQEVSINGDLIFSEANLDLLHKIVCDFEWKNQFIGIAANKSAVKTGVTNLNPRSSWYDDIPLQAFSMSTRFGGAMMNSDHDLQGAESTEPTQMILALVEKGYSIKEANEVYESIAQLINESIVEFEKVVSTTTEDFTSTDEEIKKKAYDMMVKSVERKSKSFGLLDAFVLEYLKNPETAKLPLGTPAMNALFRSEVLSWVSSNVIKRKYGGVAAVLNPSYNVVQYHILDGKNYSYSELVTGPLRQYITSGHTLYNLLNSVEYKLNDIVSTTNPFLVKVTHENPIDFEDTIVIKNTVVKDVDSGDILGYVDQYGNPTDQKYEVVKIEKFEDYIKYRHREDLEIYNWTIRPHNLKGVDVQMVYKDDDDNLYKFSANESDYNVVLWTLKNKKGVSYKNLWYSIYGVTENSNSVSKSLADEKIAIIDRVLQPYLTKDVEDRFKDKEDWKEYVIHRIVDLQRKALHEPESYIIFNNKTLTLESSKTIPAQIVMGRVYAQQFGLNQKDTINSIREGGFDFWRNKLRGKYKYNDLEASQDADFVLFSDAGDRILVKYTDEKHSIPQELNNAKDGVDLNVIDNTLYYKGQMLLSGTPNLITKQVSNEDGNYDNVLIINDLSVLDKLLQSDFERIIYNFTEDNYDIVFNKRYSFDKLKKYSLWDNGSKLDRVVSAADASIEGVEKTLLIKLLNANEVSRFEHWLDLIAKTKLNTFDDSLKFVGTRIPCQSMQSFMPCEIVYFADSEINQVYVPKHMTWIQGSDYDIDKLFLMGYSPNKDGLIQFKQGKHSSYKTTSSVLKNQIMRSIWNIVTDPRNVVSGSSEVTVKTTKSLAEKSKNAEAQKNFSPFNATVKFIMQNENSIGKDCIGITATGNKGFSVTTLFANQILYKVAELCKEATRIIAKLNVNSEEGITETQNEYLSLATSSYDAAKFLLSQLGNTVLANLNYSVFDEVYFPNIPAYPQLNQDIRALESIISKLQTEDLYSPDVAQSIGELLNAATDNAKNLILKKINADTDFIDLYIVGLMMGYKLEEVYDCLGQDTIQDIVQKSKKRNFVNSPALSKKSIVKLIEATKNVKAPMFAKLVSAAEELAILGKITKINQGLPSNKHYDNFKFTNNINTAINNLVNRHTDRNTRINESFDFLKFVVDSEYAERWIYMIDAKKVFLNPLTIIQNHTMFMTMWKAYAIADEFISRSNNYDLAVKYFEKAIVNIHKTGEITSSFQDFYTEAKKKWDLSIRQGYLKQFNIKYIAPEGLKNPALWSNIQAGTELSMGIDRQDINTFKIYLDSFVIPTLKQLYPNNKFLQRLSCTVGMTPFSDSNSVIWTPGMNMTAITDDSTLAVYYDESLSDFIQLMGIALDGQHGLPLITSNTGPILVTDLFYIYDLINNSSGNSWKSFSPFFEGDLINSYAMQHARWLENQTASELYSYYENSDYYKPTSKNEFNRIGQYVADSKRSYYTTITNKKVLEKVADSSFVVFYEDDNVDDILESYMMSKDEIETVKNSHTKAFVWNGVIFVNSSRAGESDLTHEFAHIAIGNLKTNREGRVLLSKLFEYILNTKKGQELYQSLKNIDIYKILHGKDYEEEVVCRYIQENLNDIQDPELQKIIDTLQLKVIETLSEEDDFLYDLFETKVLKYTKLQKLRVVRDELINQGNIEQECK